MTDTPKRIYAWAVPPTSHLVGTWCVTRYPDAAQEYILGSEHDRLMAEKDAEIARLLEALDDIAAWMDDPEGPHVGGVRGAKAIARAALTGDDNG